MMIFFILISIFKIVIHLWFFYTQSNCYHYPVHRGRYRFCAAWSLYNFWGPLQGKEYKITNTKLGMKLNLYLGPLQMMGPESLSFFTFTANLPLSVSRSYHDTS